MTNCELCGAGEAIKHHTSYFPEKTMFVCRKCHSKIHKAGKYPELNPPAGRSRDFHGYKQDREWRIKAMDLVKIFNKKELTDFELENKIIEAFMGIERDIKMKIWLAVQ